MLSHYRRALELWDRAGQDGWPYGHINVAESCPGPTTGGMCSPCWGRS